MSEFKDPAYQEWLQHSAKGSTWKNHKYISKKQQDDGGWTYVYGNGAYTDQEMKDKADQWISDISEREGKKQGYSEEEIQKAIETAKSQMKNDPDYQKAMSAINAYYNSDTYKQNAKSYGGDPLRSDVTIEQNQKWNNDIGEWVMYKDAEHKKKLRNNGVSLVSKSSSRIKGAKDALPFEHSDMDGDSIEHFGILGMHWGVRRSQQELGYSAGRKKSGLNSRKTNFLETEQSKKEEVERSRNEAKERVKFYGGKNAARNAVKKESSYQRGKNWLKATLGSAGGLTMTAIGAGIASGVNVSAAASLAGATIALPGVGVAAAAPITAAVVNHYIKKHADEQIAYTDDIPELSRVKTYEEN